MSTITVPNAPERYELQRPKQGQPPRDRRRPGRVPVGDHRGDMEMQLGAGGVPSIFWTNPDAAEPLKEEQRLRFTLKQG